MTELTLKGGYATSCSLLGWPGVALWVEQAVAAVGSASPRPCVDPCFLCVKARA